tara:strand:- start:33 stop:458 length:426 start_codon:yes stop_codon:yes gene_type:complete
VPLFPTKPPNILLRQKKWQNCFKKQQVTGETLKKQQMKLEALKDEQQQKATISLQLRQQIGNTVNNTGGSSNQLQQSEEEKSAMMAELNALKMKLQMSKASLVDQLRDQEEAKKAKAMNTVPATSVKDGDDAPKFDEGEES